MNRHERRAAAKKLKAQHGPNGVLVLDRTEEPEGSCDLCQKHAELRPYGPRGKWICFECAMKDEQTTARRYREHVFGDPTN